MKKHIFLFALFASLAFGFKDIESDEVATIISSNDTLVVDVRLADEWLDTGVLPGAILITYFDGQARAMKDDFMKKLREHTKGDKAQPILLICRTGYRSKLVAGVLDREGYKNIYNYKGGMVNWISEKRAVVKPKIAR